MRRNSDRCRSAIRPADCRKPSPTAKPDFCSLNRPPNRSSAGSGAHSRPSWRRTASIPCAAVRCRDRSAGTLPPPCTARCIGKPCRPKRAPPQTLAKFSFRRLRQDLRLVVKDDPREWIEFADPGRSLENRSGVRVTGIPALPDAGWTEIDVLGVALAVELRTLQLHHIHLCRTPLSSPFPHPLPVTPS